MQKVPKYLIAFYIGVSREMLSRMTKNVTNRTGKNLAWRFEIKKEDIFGQASRFFEFDAAHRTKKCARILTTAPRSSSVSNSMGIAVFGLLFESTWPGCMPAKAKNYTCRKVVLKLQCLTP